jgi:hypothetical protein
MVCAPPGYSLAYAGGLGEVDSVDSFPWNPSTTENASPRNPQGMSQGQEAA